MENPFDDTYFMKKALQEAEAAFDKNEIPVGAIIVVNDRIIARAHNLTEQLKSLLKRINSFLKLTIITKRFNVDTDVRTSHSQARLIVEELIRIYQKMQP